MHAHAADKLPEAEFATQFWLAAMFCEVSQLIRVRGCQAPACLHQSFNRFPTALLQLIATFESGAITLRLWEIGKVETPAGDRRRTIGRGNGKLCASSEARNRRIYFRYAGTHITISSRLGHKRANALHLNELLKNLLNCATHLRISAAHVFSESVRCLYFVPLENIYFWRFGSPSSPE